MPKKGASFNQKCAQGVTMVLSGKEVMGRLLENVPTLKMNKGFIRALRPYVNSIPLVLADYLPLELSVDSIAKSRLQFLKHQLQQGYAAFSINQMPKKSFDWFSSRQLTTWMMQGMMAERDLLTSMVLDTQMYLAIAGVAESQVLQSLFGGVKPPPTIEDLLAKSPELIVFDNLFQLLNFGS